MSDAITPYNFVSLQSKILPGETPPDADRYHMNRHTGWFNVTFTTRTPLYTRAARGIEEDFPPPVDTTPRIATSTQSGIDKEASVQPADFFHRGNKDNHGHWLRTPILPGSSLRGMFRSVFEIITCSRMEFFSPRRLSYRSFADKAATGLRALYEQNFDKALLVGGVLREENGRLFLRVSDLAPKGFVLIAVNTPFDQLLQNFKITTRNTVWNVNVTDIGTVPTRNLGVMEAQITGNGNEFLIVPGKDASPNRRSFQVVLTTPGPSGIGYTDYYIPAEVYDDYTSWGRMAHGQKFDMETRDVPRKLKAGRPAFALRNSENPSEISVIGANMMMALRYNQTIDQIVHPEANEPDQAPDMAKTVFGWMDQTNAYPTLRGRVFVEDAVCQEADPWLRDSAGMPARNEMDTIRIPDILSGPKATAFQTYLSQDSTDILRNWGDHGVQVRGWKRYWQRPSESVYKSLHSNSDLDAKQDKQSLQKTRIRPVREGIEFTGRIRFENLTEVELGALYACIQLPENLCHSFGMGRNLGLGSLYTCIASTTIFDMKARYASLAPNAGIRSQQNVHDILRKGYTGFVQEVDKVSPNGGRLWSSKRMQIFAALLSCKPMLPSDLTRQIHLKNSTNEMDVDAHNADQWRIRSRLPTAWQLAQQSSLITTYADVLLNSDTAVETIKCNQPVRVPIPHIFRPREEVRVVVVERDAATMLATVVLKEEPTQQFRKVPAGSCGIGDTIKLKVVRVDNSGRILELRR